MEGLLSTIGETYLSTIGETCALLAFQNTGRLKNCRRGTADTNCCHIGSDENKNKKTRQPCGLKIASQRRIQKTD